MCGIAGVVSTALRDGAGEAVRRMTGLLAHRGPDGEGFFQEPEVVFGHRRLSVIDLETGDQPMFGPGEGESARWCIVFNGEIYNYIELRGELEQLGWRFRTRSDTEVLLAAMALGGEAWLNRLNGIFAFALWDRQERSLLLARDQLGVKPLYLAPIPRGVAFASEIKALLHIEEVGRALDPEAIEQWFTLGYPLGERTIYRSIRQLRPGHLHRWSRNAGGTRRYWSLSRFVGPREAATSAPAQELEGRLRDVVRRQMRSDVPVGVFLSGGVDSSLVTALAAPCSGERIKTFSVRFPGGATDETVWARRVSRRYGTDHHVVEVGSEEVRWLPEILDQFDEPCADTAILPTWILSRYAARSLKVVLTGEGGDELFLGYPTYQGERRKEIYRNLPALLRRALTASAETLGGAVVRKRVRSFHERAILPLEQRYLDTVRCFDERILRRALGGACAGGAGVREEFAETFAGTEGADPLNRLSAVDLSTYLSQQLLPKLDRMTMAHGLEGRVPLLDRELVEWVLALPAGLKMRHGRRKSLLIRAARGHLPRGLLRRRKQGFGAPVGAWLRDSLYPGVRERLLDSGSSLYEPGAMEDLLGRLKAGETELGLAVWMFYAFLVWHDSARPPIAWRARPRPRPGSRRPTP